MRKSTCLFLLLFAAGSGLLCVGTGSGDEAFTSSQYHFGRPNAPNTEAKSALLNTIENANDEVLVVLNSMTDTDIADALIAARDRGVAVHTAADHSIFGGNTVDPVSDYEIPCLYTGDLAKISDPGFNKVYENGIPIRTNKCRTAARFDASRHDGRVENNMVVSDFYFCWNSTHGADEKVFEGTAGVSEYSISFAIRSREICSDFQKEATVLARAGLFSDEGDPSFGDFRYNKTTDPYTEFKQQGFTYKIYFGAQESHLNPIVTRLLNSRGSIRFAARSMTQDAVNNVTDADENRSEILTTLSYKNNIGRSVSGVIAADPQLTESVRIPGRNSFLRISIHSQLQTLLGDEKLRKHPGSLNFTLYLMDEYGSSPAIILLSSDLRKRLAVPENFANANTDYFYLSDSVMMQIEKTFQGSPTQIFTDFSGFMNEIERDSNNENF